MAVITTNTKTLSTVASALPNVPCRQVVVHNNDGSINMLVGNATTQSYTLGPGQECPILVSNANQVYVKSASGTPVLSFICS